MTEKQLIHDLFVQGKSYREIGMILNSNASAVALRITRYRKENPEAWPRLRKYTEPISVRVKVFRCRECVYIFAAEKDDELENDVCCPVCWSSESLDAIGTSYIKLNEH